MLIDQYQQQHWGNSTHGFWQRIGQLLQSLGRKIERLSQLADQRQQLLDMDDLILKDIGLTRAEARRMAGWQWFQSDPLLSTKK